MSSQKEDTTVQNFKVCYTFQEEEDPVRIQSSPTQTIESGVISQRKNFDFFIHNGSLGVIEKDVKTLFYIYNDLPKIDSVYKEGNKNDFKRLVSDQMESFQQLEQYYSYIIPPQFPQYLILYGVNIQNQLCFIFYEIQKKETLINEKDQQLKKNTIEIKLIPDGVKQVSKTIQGKLVQVQMDAKMNYFICYYDNGILTRVKNPKKFQDQKNLLLQGKELQEVELGRKQIEKFGFKDQKNQQEKQILYYTQKNGIYYLKNLDLENDKKINLNQSQSIYNSKSNDRIKFIEIDDQLQQIYFVETINNNDYLRIYEEESNSIDEKIIPIQGICKDFKRNKKYVYLTIEKTQGDKTVEMFFIYDMLNEYLAFKFLKANHSILTYSFYNEGVFLVLKSQKEEKQFLKQIIEYNDQEKFEKFNKRLFFDLASKFAENNGEINLKYQVLKKAGEHYFSKEMYDEAIEYYIRTIEGYAAGGKERKEFAPNFIYKKFLNTSLQPYLIRYLEALHDYPQQVADIHDTTLLVSSYLNQDMEEKIIKWFRVHKLEKNTDSEKIIDACLEYDKISLAKTLAKEASMYQKYIEISIENFYFDEKSLIKSEETKELLTFIGNIPNEEFKKSISNYGQLFYKYQPQITLSIIQEHLEEMRIKDSENYSPLEFLTIFEDFQKTANYPQTEIFLSYCLKKLRQFSKDHLKTAIFLSNGFVYLIKNTKDQAQERNLLQQLDYLLDVENLRNVDKDIFYNYLLYLFTDRKLIKMKKTVMQRMGKNLELIKICFEQEEFEECLNICCANENDPDLSIYYLKLICGRESENNNCEQHIPRLLILIREQKTFSDYFVIDLLKKNRFLKLDHIKQFFQKIFQEKKTNITHLQENIEKNTKALKEQEEQIKNLKVYPKVIQQNKCSECQEISTYPSIFFYCGHLFHSRCVEGRICPYCDVSHQQILDNRKMFQQERIYEEEFVDFDYENLISKIGIAKFQLINQ